MDADNRQLECWKHGSDVLARDRRARARCPATDAGAGVTRPPRRRRPLRGGALMAELVIEGLRAGVRGKEILRGIDLTVRSGEVHAVMGPNGSGKSTLSHVVMGRPGYEVLGGSVTLDGEDVLAMEPWQRAQAGLFLAMQYPTEVPGVSLDRRARGVVRGRRAARRPRCPSCCGPRPSASASTSASSPDRSTSTCPAARRSATRRCSSGCSARRSPCSTSSTPASTSTPCGPAPAGSSRPPRRPGSACSPSPTTAACCTSSAADVIHILVRGEIRDTGGPELAEQLEESGYAAWTPGRGRRDRRRAVADPFADPFGPGPFAE